jgi:hypothetical protein
MKTGVSCKILQIGPQIHKLTEQIRQWLETPESYRYSFLKELISLNKKLHANREAYDHILPHRT